MSKKILVGLDGSSLAETALPYAEVFARANHGQVVLVRVIRMDGLPADAPEEPGTGSAQPTSRSRGMFSSDVTVERRAVSEAEHYLQAIAEQMGRNGVVADTVVDVGDPATVLVEEAQLRDTEMIVLSTHGRSGVGRWIYGSVADAVMRRSNVPVLLVPPACHPTWPRDRTPRILVPLDGSILAGEALDPAERLAQSLGAGLILIRVIEPVVYGYVGTPDMEPYTARDPETEAATARAELDEIVVRLRRKGLMAHHHVLHGPVVPIIVGEAQDESISLIAIASHGSGGLTRLVMGSVATGILRSAVAPILVVRPSAIRAVQEESRVTSERTAVAAMPE